MASMRDIKQRIENVTSTTQIIKAMDSIASSKLQRARAQLDNVKPIYNGLNKTIAKISSHQEVETHPYYKNKENGSSLYIVLTSNQGFAGGYNIGVLKKALAHMEGKDERIIVIGKKGGSFFSRHNKNIIRILDDIADANVYFAAENISLTVNRYYLEEEYKEVFIAKTEFENILSSKPKIIQLLPLQYIEPDIKQERIYSPNLHTVLDNVIPLFLHMSLFEAFADSHTSEQATRMVTMDEAGKNAEELIEELSKQYNRERQAQITQELNEISSGITSHI